MLAVQKEIIGKSAKDRALSRLDLTLKLTCLRYPQGYSAMEPHFSGVAY